MLLSICITFPLILSLQVSTAFRTNAIPLMKQERKGLQELPRSMPGNPPVSSIGTATSCQNLVSPLLIIHSSFYVPLFRQRDLLRIVVDMNRFRGYIDVD